jgi:glucose/arabinose dehydrogenase
MNVVPVYLWGFWVLWLAFVVGHVWFRLLSGVRPLRWGIALGVLGGFVFVLYAASGGLTGVPVLKAMLGGMKRGDTEWWLLLIGAGLSSLPVGFLAWSVPGTPLGSRWAAVWHRTLPLGIALGVVGFIGGLLVQTGTDKKLRSSFAPAPTGPQTTGKGFSVQKVAEIGDFPIRLTRTPDNRVLFSFNRTRAGFEDGGVYGLSESPDGGFRVNLMAFHPSLHRAYGLAVWRDEILVARAGHSVDATNGRMLYPPNGAVTRLMDLDGNGYAEFQDDLVAGLPGVNGDSTQHQNNGVCADIDGNLYITSATGGNRRPALQEWEGCILKFNRATGKTEVFAEGFRNPWGIAFNDKGDLFVTDNDIGANPGDELNHVIRGEHYGHPYVVVGEETAGEGFRHPVWSSEEANLCGLVYVGADSPLPDRFKNAFFICDMARSAVIRVELAPHGDSYKLVKSETAFTVPTPVDIVHMDNGDFFVTSYYERAVYRISWKP